MATEKKNQTWEIFKAYLMLGLFLTYFLFITAFAVFIFSLSLLCIVLFVPEMFGSVGEIISGLFMILLIGFVNYAIFKATITPIIRLVAQQRSKLGWEITKDQAPLLFEVIDEVAERVGSKKPKHVFLFDGANASASFDSPITSIFYPVPKNLSIGLDLFVGSNKSELKSILAHEFGHFSQKTMHVGTCAYAAETICTGYLEALASMRGEVNIFIYLIILLHWNIVKLLAKGVHATYRSLERRMEFDADEIAAETYTPAIYTSAFCKIKAQEYQLQGFGQVFGSLIAEGEYVVDRFNCQEYWWKLFPHYSQFDISATKILTHIPQVANPHISIIDKEDTHPTDMARIDNVAKIAKHNDIIIDTKPSIELLPQTLIEEYYQELNTNNLKVISLEQFKKWFQSYAANNYMDARTFTYFSHPFIQFDTNESSQIVVSSPFTFENAKQLEEYESVFVDNLILKQLSKGILPYANLKYDNIEIKTLQELKEKHQAQLKLAAHSASTIYKQIFAYLISQENVDSYIVTQLFNNIIAVSNDISELLDIIYTIHAKAKVSEDNEVDVGKQEKDFKAIIRKYDDSALQQFCTQDVIETIHSIHYKSYNMITHTNWNLVNELLHAINYFSSILRNMEESYKMRLSHIAARFF